MATFIRNSHGRMSILKLNDRPRDCDCKQHEMFVHDLWNAHLNLLLSLNQSGKSLEHSEKHYLLMINKVAIIQDNILSVYYSNGVICNIIIII